MHGAAKSAWLSPKPDVSGGGFVRSRAGGARITLLPLYVENATRWNPGSSGVDLVILDPGDSAFADRSVVRHDQAKALGNKRRVLDIDGGALLVRTRRTRTERACGAATGESVDSRNLQ